jgi:endonuclease YncB( thermonuclease family)
MREAMVRVDGTRVGLWLVEAGNAAFIGFLRIDPAYNRHQFDGSQLELTRLRFAKRAPGVRNASGALVGSCTA